MISYSIEPKTRKYVKGYGFLSFAKNIIQQIRKKILGYCYKNRNMCCENYFQKLVQKTSEPTGELIGNKISEKSENRNLSMSDMNSRNVQEKYFPPEKIQGILKKKSRYVLQNRSLENI